MSVPILLYGHRFESRRRDPDYESAKGTRARFWPPSVRGETSSSQDRQKRFGYSLMTFLRPLQQKSTPTPIVPSHEQYCLGPCGLMDKAPDFGSGDCRFESCHGRRNFFLLLLHSLPGAGSPSRQDWRPRDPGKSPPPVRHRSNLCKPTDPVRASHYAARCLCRQSAICETLTDRHEFVKPTGY